MVVYNYIDFIIIIVIVVDVIIVTVIVMIITVYSSDLQTICSTFTFPIYITVL